MSWKIVTRVRERRFGTAHRKSVMVCLADRASDNGAGIWLGKKGIARETEISLNTVKKILDDFVDEGLIENAGVHPRFKTQQYNILVPAVLQLPLLDDEGSDLTPPQKEGSDLTPGGSNSGQRGHGETPEGSSGDPKPKTQNQKPIAHARASLVEELTPLCATAVEKNALSILLREVSGFDGRRVLVTSKFYLDQINGSLSRELSQAGFKLVNNPAEILTDDGGA